MAADTCSKLMPCMRGATAPKQHSVRIPGLVSCAPGVMSTDLCFALHAPDSTEPLPSMHIPRANASMLAVQETRGPQQSLVMHRAQHHLLQGGDGNGNLNGNGNIGSGNGNANGNGQATSIATTGAFVPINAAAVAALLAAGSSYNGAASQAVCHA